MMMIKLKTLWLYSTRQVMWKSGEGGWRQVCWKLNTLLVTKAALMISADGSWLMTSITNNVHVMDQGRRLTYPKMGGCRDFYQWGSSPGWRVAFSAFCESFINIISMMQIHHNRQPENNQVRYANNSHTTAEVLSWDPVSEAWMAVGQLETPRLNISVQ